MIARQGDSTEIELVKDEIVSEGHVRWEKIYGIGQRPDPEEECNLQQLTCLNHLIVTGQPPTVDFAVWGPHGLRIERKLRLSGQVFAPDGTLRSVEIAGPPDVNVWMASYDVFATGAIMLNVLDLGILLQYRKMIHRFHTRYGSQAKSCQLLLTYHSGSQNKIQN